MPVQLTKIQPKKDPVILNTHNVGVHLPMNTKYVSGNPLSRFLIRKFVDDIIFIVTSKIFSAAAILDVGCGEGMISRQIRRVWPSAVLHGFDIDPELLRVARQIAPEMGFVTGSVYSLPFADAMYDFILCTEVLEHLEQPESALAEISRVGRGFFLFSVPNEPLWRIANMARGAYWRDLGNSPGHQNHWTSNAFVLLLSKFFEIMTIKRPFPWTIVLCRKK